MSSSKMHILTTVMSLHYSEKEILPEIIAYSVLPDSIGCFNFGNGIKNNHVVTHFEVHPVTGIASGMVYPMPDKLKILTTEMVQQGISHVEKNYRKNVIRNFTNIGTFVQLNNHLPENEFKCIFLHLLQDSINDNYIRYLIDTSQKRKKIFKFNITDEIYDVTSVRQLIDEIEKQEFRYLSRLFAKETGYDTKVYFESVVFPAIRKTFCKKMADTTIKNISFDDSGKDVLPNDICDKIVNHLCSATIW